MRVELRIDVRNLEDTCLCPTYKVTSVSLLNLGYGPDGSHHLVWKNMWLLGEQKGEEKREEGEVKDLK